ncbi:MAG: DUF3368 domain-containing protein [Verrucomicrobia bacterium]|nr:DUF3368 domain-containing protein [Verrucomicrobiota bacterium]
MTVVCDASPLIFLCKLRRLDLLPEILGGELLIPDDIERELFAAPVNPAEEALLRRFLKKHSRVVRIRPRGFRTSALSKADRTVLTLAAREKAAGIVSDDRLLRDLAEVEGIKPIGTLGILLKALRVGILTPEDARDALHALIAEHGFRISIQLYEAVLSTIGKD